eukprot:gene14310-656_t
MAGVDASGLRQMQYLLEERLGRLDLRHGEVESRQWIRKLHISAPHGHLAALENAGWLAAGGLHAAVHQTPLFGTKGGSCPTAPHRPHDAFGARDPVFTIFEIFDADGDGAWSFEEANEWFRATQDVEVAVEDWRDTCASLEADPDRGLSLRQVRQVYAQ